MAFSHFIILAVVSVTASYGSPLFGQLTFIDKLTDILPIPDKINELVDNFIPERKSAILN